MDTMRRGIKPPREHRAAARAAALTLRIIIPQGAENANRFRSVFINATQEQA